MSKRLLNTLDSSPDAKVLHITNYTFSGNSSVNVQNWQSGSGVQNIQQDKITSGTLRILFEIRLLFLIFIIKWPRKINFLKIGNEFFWKHYTVDFVANAKLETFF